MFILSEHSSAVSKQTPILSKYPEVVVTNILSLIYEGKSQYKLVLFSVIKGLTLCVCQILSGCTSSETKLWETGSIWVTSLSSYYNVSWGLCPPSICTTKKRSRWKSNSDVREPENGDSLLVRTNWQSCRYKAKVSFYQWHLKNANFSHVVPMLWHWCLTLCQTFGRWIWVVLILFVIVLSHEEEQLFIPSICGLIWCYLTWQQICFCFLLSFSSFFSKHLKKKSIYVCARWWKTIKVIEFLHAA